MIVPTIIKEWLKRHPSVLCDLEFVGADLVISYWTPDKKNKLGSVTLTVDDQQRIMQWVAGKVSDLIKKENAQ